MICPKFVIIAIIPRASSLIYVKISNTTTQSTFNRCRPLHMYSWELYKLHPSLGHRRPVECKQMREAGSYNVDASLQALHSSNSGWTSLCDAMQVKVPNFRRGSINGLVPAPPTPSRGSSRGSSWEWNRPSAATLPWRHPAAESEAAPSNDILTREGLPQCKHCWIVWHFDNTKYWPCRSGSNFCKIYTSSFQIIFLEILQTVLFGWFYLQNLQIIPDHRWSLLKVMAFLLSIASALNTMLTLSSWTGGPARWFFLTHSSPSTILAFFFLSVIPNTLFVFVVSSFRLAFIAVSLISFEDPQQEHK